MQGGKRQNAYITICEERKKIRNSISRTLSYHIHQQHVDCVYILKNKTRLLVYRLQNKEVEVYYFGFISIPNRQFIYQTINITIKLLILQQQLYNSKQVPINVSEMESFPIGMPRGSYIILKSLKVYPYSQIQQLYWYHCFPSSLPSQVKPFLTSSFTNFFLRVKNCFKTGC